MQQELGLAENVENMKVAQGAVAKVTGSGGRLFFNDRFSFKRSVKLIGWHKDKDFGTFLSSDGFILYENIVL